MTRFRPFACFVCLNEVFFQLPNTLTNPKYYSVSIAHVREFSRQLNIIIQGHILLKDFTKAITSVFSTAERSYIEQTIQLSLNQSIKKLDKFIKKIQFTNKLLGTPPNVSYRQKLKEIQYSQLFTSTLSFGSDIYFVFWRHIYTTKSFGRNHTYNNCWDLQNVL